MKNLDRDQAEVMLVELVDEWDAEDASHLIDVLMERFTLNEACSWLCFYDVDLDSTPLWALEQGRARQVLTLARKLVLDGV